MVVWIKKAVTNAEISLKIANPRDIASKTEEEEMEAQHCLSPRQKVGEVRLECYISHAARIQHIPTSSM